MYAWGMTTREIQGHLQEIYGMEVSPSLISSVTDAVVEEVKEWQSRPLEPLYPILFLDALMVKMRHEWQVENRAVYVADERAEERAPLTASTSGQIIPTVQGENPGHYQRVVLNRKNSLFVGNSRGGRTAVILASLTSTCHRHDADPQLYLTQVLINLPATSIAELPAWLPDRWKLIHSAQPPL